MPCTYCWWFRNPARNQLRLVVYPMIYRVLYIPGGCLGFLNHQQYDSQLLPIWCIRLYPTCILPFGRAKIVSWGSHSHGMPGMLTRSFVDGSHEKETWLIYSIIWDESILKYPRWWTIIIDPLQPYRNPFSTSSIRPKFEILILPRIFDVNVSHLGCVCVCVCVCTLYFC